MRKTIVLGVIVAAVSVGRAASAEPTRVGTAAAQALFDDAKALMAKGDLAAACPKFVESHRIDPSGGTILHAAYCHEAQGKIATAWSEYNDALGLALRDKRADREKVARERILALGARVGKLKLALSPEARATPGLEIAIDGAALPPEAFETPLPLDAGKHAVRISAPSRAPRTIEVAVEDGAVASAAVPGLSAAPSSDGFAASSPPGSAAPAADARVTPDAAGDPGRDRRMLGLVTGGVGVVGLAVGTVFGVRAMGIGDQYSEADGCVSVGGTKRCPDGERVSQQDDARTSATVSTVAFVAGGVLVAAGAVLYLTAPKSGRTTTASAAAAGDGAAVWITSRF